MRFTDLSKGFLTLAFFVSLGACDVKCEVHSSPSLLIDAGETSKLSIPQDASASPVKQIKNVLVIGDSEAGRVSFRLSELNKEHKDQAYSVEYKVGTTVEYWANGKFVEALNRHPDVDTVVVFLGTNNYYASSTPNVQPILDVIKQKKLRCVWVGPTSVHGKRWLVNQLLKDSVTPVCSYFDTENSNIPLEDGVHPTYDGILVWLHGVWKLL